MKSGHFKGFLFVSSAFLAPTAPAQAQQTAAQADAIQDIIVTATRSDSSAQKTPVGLNVYSGDKLADSGVASVAALQTIDPSVNLSTNGGQSYIAIRGIASTDLTEIGDPSVPVARDGFFTNRSFSIASSMYDLERVEVLKGPQGTLFGRNSTGGLIQLITRKPGDELAGNAAVEYGNYNTLNVDAGIDVPVSGVVKLRFSGIRRYHKGYRDIDVADIRGDDDNTWSGRATLAITPNNGLTMLLQYQHDSYDMVGDVALKTGFGVSAEGLNSKKFPNLTDTRSRLEGDRIRWEVSYNRLPGDLTLTYAGGFDVQDWHRKTDLTPMDASGNPTYARALHMRETPETWNHEIRLATPQQNKFSAQVGYYYFNEKNDLYTYAAYEDGPYAGQTEVIFPYRVKTQSQAVFGQFGYRFADTLRLTVGARNTWDKKQRSGSWLLYCDVAGIPDFAQAGAGCSGTPPVRITDGNGRVGESQPTYHVGIDWTPTPTNMVYAKFDTGYKAGGFNSSGGGSSVPYDAESLKAFEIGTKNRFMGNTIQLNASAFYQIYDGYQAEQTTSVLSTSAQGVFNVGRAKIYGVEGQLIGKFGSLHLDLNATALRAKFGAVPLVYQDNVGDVDVSHNILPNAPTFVLNAGLEYEFELGNLTVTPRIDGKYSSSYYFSVFNDNDTRQDAYATGNLSLKIQPQNLPFDVLLYVRNFTDETVYSVAARNTNMTANQYQYQPPRTYGIRVSSEF